MDAETVLEGRALSFVAGQKRILDDVSVELGRGETLALLGPSGCGKTTLLRIIAGLVRPTAGHVRIEDRDVTHLPANRRGVGMMFQDYALFPHMDVARNVGFGLRHAKLSREHRAERVQEMLRLTGMEGYQHRTIEALSGGERQRVALARTLAPQPAVLLLDEPLGALDRVLRDQLTVELREILVGLSASTIYVTHDQAEAFGIASRVLLMNEGRIVRSGTPAEIYRHPGTPFIARFLGMNNILPARRVGATWQTEAGDWPAGEEGATSGQLLLRPDGVAATDGPGMSTVSGHLLARVFQGATMAVRVATTAGTMQFNVSADEDLPDEGETIHLAVREVQLLEDEPEAVDRTGDEG